MLRAVIEFFERNFLVSDADAEVSGGEKHRLQLAVAALLMEMSRMDDSVHEEECDAIEEAIRGQFSLSVEETRDLMDLATVEGKDANDYFQFTSLINLHYTQEQRVELVEYLWRVAYANSALNPYEEHLARKLAELLRIPHSAFIAAKHRAGSRG
jgi:uncharacterized tellurite resistance protein B-like protein